ncbi:hypothetical protein NE857_31575 [Nocardiopsis exhalans]|uniref:Uncharacterized protein n=1 Tax=Nocardiopsis exhalans TaxID=163604 RepID=A0ABY5D8L2_9ACTN|nr:hypothetical protein [Nocardiopsis exhalans]USY19720.1 hypothetical protein NE857_31575 [Nocardiopsis exhalans]
MTRFVSTRYPQLRIPALRVRFRDGHATVKDPDVAARLASWPTQGVGLAPGESLPNAQEKQEEDDPNPNPDQTPDQTGNEQGGEPQRPAKTARREDWQDYILATYDVDADEAKDMTKAQLQTLDADLSGDDE